MARFTFACCAILSLVLALAASTIPATTTAVAKAAVAKAKTQQTPRFRFLVLPTQAKNGLQAVPAHNKQKPPKEGALVSCDCLRFETNAIVFVNATLESQGQRITASEATVRLDKAPADMSWALSKDFKLKLLNAEAKKEFLRSQRQ